ncbi:MAG: YjjG family noncanonical pyrimidine nucleotidase [Betaproteobacteria bacterium]
MFPKAILFDLDDTLFDHQHASNIALIAMHAEHAGDVEFAPFATKHHEVLEEFHRHFLDGKYTLDQARVARMKVLFASFGRDIDDDKALAAAALYRTQHQSNRQLLPGARELLDALHSTLQATTRLGIVTNNSTVEQHEKLRALDIARYFDTIIISEDAGVSKPDPRIFGLALERIGVHADEAVMIGDNWHNDIQGALDAGMTAVWLNRKINEQTPAPARSPGHFSPASRANTGVSNENLVEIASLEPLDTVFAAIKKAFTKRIPGVTHNEQLETLAP